MQELWDEGRLEAVLSLCHPDMEWYEPPETPDRTVTSGRENALRALQTWMSTWSSYEYDVVEMRSHGDKVLVEVRQRMEGAASGLPISMELFQVWTVRDGLATSMEMYTDRTQALEASGL